MTRRLAAWWLRRWLFCFVCDRRTIVRHFHHDVHHEVDGWWLR